MSNARLVPILALLLGGMLLLPATRARAEEGPVINDVLGILKERGIVTEEQYTELTAKNTYYEMKQAPLLGKIEFSGDLRTRFEGFMYDRDAFDNDRSNRWRGRYRVRLQAKAPINPYVNAYFRLASGEDDIRSTNQTLGGRDADFDPDGIFIDRAYLELFPVRDEYMPVAGGKLTVHAGKTPNPFVWKNTRDIMLWDNDINPEGAAFLFNAKTSETLSWFANGGYFVVDENSTTSDPHLIGLQVGGAYKATGFVEVGGRLSWYDWRSLDPAFIGRGVNDTTTTTGGGNIVDGVTGDSDSGDGIQAGEVAAYVRLTHFADWPIVMFAQYAQNFDAEDSQLFPGADQEDQAYGAGIEVGDKKKWVTLGGAYYAIEANAWPAQFTDSDLFDGFTNREGFAFYAVREILPNTDLSLTTFFSNDIDDNITSFPVSVRDAERFRIQADLEVKF